MLSGDALCAVPSGPRGQWRSQETPRPTCSAHRGPKGFPAGAAPQPRDSLPLSLSPLVPRARGAPPRAHHSAAPATARESAPPPLPRSKRLGAVVPEGLEGGGGVGRDREGGNLAPRPPRAAAFSTLPLGSAPFASPAANGNTPRRQMTRKYVTGRGVLPWGWGPAPALLRPLPHRGTQVDPPGREVTWTELVATRSPPLR